MNFVLLRVYRAQYTTKKKTKKTIPVKLVEEKTVFVNYFTRYTVTAWLKSVLTVPGLYDYAHDLFSSDSSAKNVILIFSKTNNRIL